MSDTEIKQKIIEGCKLAVRRLIERKQKENGYLIISRQGKVVKVLATDIK